MKVAVATVRNSAIRYHLHVSVWDCGSVRADMADMLTTILIKSSAALLPNRCEPFCSANLERKTDPRKH